MEAFANGFYTVCDQQLIGVRSSVPLYVVHRLKLQLLRAEELDLLACGRHEISDEEVQVMRQHCEYDGYTKNNDTVKHFWEWMEKVRKRLFVHFVMHTMQANQSERRALLKFVTGCERVPFGGLRDNSHMLIARMTNTQLLAFPYKSFYNFKPCRLPVAHTCANQLMLPNYKSSKLLDKQLRIALKHGSEGFGIY